MVYAYLVSKIISCTCTLTFSYVIILAGTQQRVQLDMCAWHSMGSQGLDGSRGVGGGGAGGPVLPEKSQNLSNTGQDPMKNHKAIKPAFNVGPSSFNIGPSSFNVGPSSFDVWPS